MIRRRQHQPLAEINVVPYIDVMLVLLVIFMIATPLIMQSVQVQLPQAKAKAITFKNEMPIVVSIDRQGRYYLNVSSQPAQTLNGQELMTQVAAHLTIAQQKHQKPIIYVKGDRDVNYGNVVQLTALLHQAGAQQVGLVTQPDSQTN